MTTAGVTSICFEHPRSPDTEDAPALSHTILVLAGTTGAGKHTIARELSARIGTSYIDANQEEGVDAAHTTSPSALLSLNDVAQAALKTCSAARRLAIVTHPLLLRAHRDALREHVRRSGSGAVLRVVYLVGMKGDSEMSGTGMGGAEGEGEVEEVPVAGEEEGCLVVDTRGLSVGDVVGVVGDWVWE